MNVLVTGSAGFIGGHLCERLRADGHEVTTFDIKDDWGQNVVLLCYLDNAVFDNKPECIIHLAAKAGVRDSLRYPGEYVKTNVVGTNNVLEAAASHECVKHVVFASSSSVYGDVSSGNYSQYRDDWDDGGVPEWIASSPMSPYAATKVAGEALCQAYTNSLGIQTTCLRFFTVYGPNCRTSMAVGSFLKSMLSGTPLTLYGDGTQARDLTYVTDIVDGIVRAMENPKGFQTFNLGAGEPVNMNRLINMLSEITITADPTIDHQPPSPCDVPYTHADTSLAREVLGWEPKVRIDEGLRRTAEWFKENMDAV